MSLRVRMRAWIASRLGLASEKTYLTRVLAFGMKYLKPYWHRFVLGVVLGIVFGALNGAFVSATYLLVNRLIGEESKPKVTMTADLLNSASPAVEDKSVSAASTPDLSSDNSNAAKRPASFFAPVTHFFHAIGSWTKTEIINPVHGWWNKIVDWLAPITNYFKAAVAKIKEKFHVFFIHFIDPWLPLKGRGLDWKQVLGGLLLLPVLTGLRGGIGYASSYYMAWTSQRVVMDLKADVFRKLNDLSLDFFSNSTTANILTRINGDTTALNGALRLGLSDLVKEPITVVGIFVSMLLLDAQLTFMAMFFIPLMVVPMQIISKKIRSLAHSSYELDLKQGSLLMDAFINIRIVQAFGLQKQQKEDFVAQNRRAMRMGLRSMQAKEILNPIIELFSAVGLSAVIIFIFFTGRSASTLMMFSVALGMFYTPFKKLAGIHLYFVQTEVPLKRLMELFAMEPTVVDSPNPKQLPEFRQGLRLRNVSFYYKEDRPVLRAVNIDVPRGKKIGLAGDSGSGKSTLINLLFRFYDPTNGAIEVDGINIRDLSLAQLRQHMALVSQDILLFNATVADNIGFGKIGSTREEIIQAARSAYAHDFIMSMPQGYDTPIGERGVLISGGQRQRLAIARAFVRNAPILVLDEATASLDSQAEAEVQAAIDRLANGRTVVCIAHRLSTLSSMDNIYVLREGQVIEQGGFEELLRRGGIFAGMAKRQSIVASSVAA